MNTAGNEYTAGFVEHRANNGSWRVLPAAGNGVVGYGYGVGKTYPRVTRTEPYRLCHGYGFTRGVPKTGIAGTGTVCHFGTPQYTAYPYRGVTGIHGLMYTIGGFIILIIMYLQMSYLSFDAEICDRAEFKTPLNVVFETRLPSSSSSSLDIKLQGPGS
jgi:hypothetical protein